MSVKLVEVKKESIMSSMSCGGQIHPVETFVYTWICPQCHRECRDSRSYTMLYLSCFACNCILEKNDFCEEWKIYSEEDEEIAKK